jgi:hypothetical protein
MATVKPSYSAQSTIISTELNSLADTSAATGTAEIDNTTNRYLDGYLDCYFNGAGATTGSVAVYLLCGNATGETSTTAKTSNMRYVGSVELNGTTAVRKQLEVNGLPKFWNVRCINNSGAALAASGNLIKFTGLNYSDV